MTPKEAKHTPGPLPLKMDVGRMSDQYVIVTNQGNHYATTYDPSAARVILAAHDMLRALKTAEAFYVSELEDLGGCDHPVNICVCGVVAELDDLRAAIQKAEGQGKP